MNDDWSFGEFVFYFSGGRVRECCAQAGLMGRN